MNEDDTPFHSYLSTTWKSAGNVECVGRIFVALGSNVQELWYNENVPTLQLVDIICGSRVLLHIASTSVKVLVQ
jgi:hypothetical protein